jgi:hypothetical protein
MPSVRENRTLSRIVGSELNDGQFDSGHLAAIPREHAANRRQLLGAMPRTALSRAGSLPLRVNSKLPFPAA